MVHFRQFQKTCEKLNPRVTFFYVYTYMHNIRRYISNGLLSRWVGAQGDECKGFVDSERFNQKKTRFVKKKIFSLKVEMFH